MSPWFRRRRDPEPAPPQAPADPAPVATEPQPEAAEEPVDPAAPPSPDRLDSALKRLRKEIPAPSEESPSGPSE